MPVILSRKGGGSAGGGGPPSGAAGGDLGGTYPNPTVTNLIPKTVVDAKGDLLVASAADTVTRLPVGATNGMVLEAASGAGTGVQWDLPAGHEFSYVEFTAPVTISAVSEATANTIVTAGAVTFDGATAVIIEFFGPANEVGNNDTIAFALYDGAASIGKPGFISSSGSNTFIPAFLTRKLTPSAAAHTYSMRAYRTAVNGTIIAGVGGSGNNMPGYIRIVKV